MPQPERFSDYLAILALLVSCASFYLSWRNFRRDRSHLKLSLDFENRGKQGRQFQVTLTNDGRRTATILHVDALLWLRKRQTVFQQETPLVEGKQKVIFAPLVMLPSISHPLAVRGFEAVDSVGHKYRVSTLRLFLKIMTTKE